MVRRRLGLLSLWVLAASWTLGAQEPGFADLDPRERQRAAESASSAQVAEVSSLLGDPDLSVRRAAVEALLRFGAPSIRPLLSLVERRGAPRLQRGVARVFARLPTRELAQEQAALIAAGYTQQLLRIGDAGLAEPQTVLALVRHRPGLVDLRHDLQLVREGALARRAWARPALVRALGDEQLRARALAGLGQLEEAAQGSEQLLEALLRSGELAPIEVAYAAKALASLDQRGRLQGCYRALPEATRQHLLTGVAAAGEAGLACLHALAQADDAALEKALGELAAMTYGRGFVPAGGLATLRLALAHPLPGARHAALQVLSECNALPAPELLRGLQDSHPAIRRHALELIRSWGEETPSPGEVQAEAKLFEGPLVAILRRDPEPELRLEAAATLGAVARGPAADAALRAALSAEDPQLRAAAAEALSRLPPEPELIELLTRRAETDSERSVRGAAALALARLGATSSAARLVLAAEGDALEALAEALGDHGPDPRSGEAPWPRAAIAKLLASDSSAGRGLGARLVHELGPLDLELQPSRVAAIRSDSTGYLIDGLAGALTREELRALALGERAAGEAARIWGSRPAEAEAYVAAFAQAPAHAYPMLKSLRPWHRGALPQLKRALAQEERLDFALRGLARLGPSAAPALPELIELLPPPGQREGLAKAVVEVLVSVGPAAAPALPRLLPLLRAEDDYLVVDVYQALAGLGAGARPAFAAMLAARGEAEQIVPERTLEPLTRVARACAAAGRPVELAPALAALTAAVDSTDSFWPEAALAALRDLGPLAREAAPPLLERALDPWLEPESRGLALDALRAIAPELRGAVLRGLREELASVEREERRVAADLLRDLGAVDRALVMTCSGELAQAREGSEREQAARALLACGPLAAAEVGRLLSHPDASPGVARALASLLGDEPATFAAPEGLGVLRGALAHHDLRVREGAAWALAWGAARGQLELEPPVLDAALRLLGGRAARELPLVEGLGPRARAALPALTQALDGPGWREERARALRGIAALGSGASPAAPRLRRIFRDEEPGCVLAACALLELSPEDEAQARAKLRAWLPNLPRALLGEVASRFGRERGSWTPADRRLALAQLERVLRYQGRLSKGVEAALRACLELGARERVAALAEDEGAPAELREVARRLLK